MKTSSSSPKDVHKMQRCGQEKQNPHIIHNGERIPPHLAYDEYEKSNRPPCCRQQPNSSGIISTKVSSINPAIRSNRKQRATGG